MTRGRVIFVNRFYWPEEPATALLLTDLTCALAARGYDVSVITSRPNDQRIPPTELKDGVRIARIGPARLGRRNGLARLLDFTAFNIGAFWRLLWSTSAEDTVVAMTDPPMLGVAAWLATSLRRARLIHWVQDIYPEIAAQLTGEQALQLLKPIRDLSWRSGAACVVPGRQMAAAVEASTGKVTPVIVMPNWAPAGLSGASPDEIAALRDRWTLQGKFIAMYSGNLGRAHDLEPLLDVAERLRDVTEIAFAFVGDGARREALETAARRRHLHNVHFFPAQPRHFLGVSLSAGDVHFVTLQPGAERWVFPSKLYGIAAVRRPVLFIGAQDSEIAQEIREAGAGETFAAVDTEGIANALRRLRSASVQSGQAAPSAGRPRAEGLEQAVDNWCHLLGPRLATHAPTR